MSRCRYCGREFSYTERHEKACPKHPEIAARLFAFMRYWAEEGVAFPRSLYQDFAVDYREEHGHVLPGVNELERAYGSWLAFAHACGLEYTPSKAHVQRKGTDLDPQVMPGSVMAEDYTVYDPSALRCEPVARPVRSWQPRAKVWAVVGAQLVWQVR